MPGSEPLGIRVAIQQLYLALSQPMRLAIWLLWLVPHALSILVLVIASRKRRLSAYPLFFSYLGLCVVETVIALWLGMYSESLYANFAVFSVVSEDALEVAAIYELAHGLFLSSPRLRQFLGPLPKWTAVALCLLAGIITGLLPQRIPWMAAYVNVSFFLNVVLIGLLVSLLLITTTLGISWSRLPSAIAVGLGSEAIGVLIANIVFAEAKHVGLSDVIRLGGAALASVVWVIAILSEKDPQPNTTIRSDLSSLDLETEKMSGILK